MNRNTLKQWFSNGKKPSQEQFWEWIDSFWHKEEKIPQSNVEGLNTSLNNKAEESLVQAHYADEEAHGIKDKLAKKADVTALEKVKESIGELTDLKSGDKSNVVAAINELINQYENDDKRFQGVLTIEDNRNSIGFYFAMESGKFVNAGGLEVDLTKGLYILSYDGVEWEAECVTLELGLTEDKLKTINGQSLVGKGDIKVQTEDASKLPRDGSQPMLKTLTLAKGENNAPSLIIPSGVLSSTLHDGAIERDANGKLYTTYKDNRYSLLDKQDLAQFMKTLFRCNRYRTGFRPLSLNKSGTDKVEIKLDILSDVSLFEVLQTVLNGILGVGYNTSNISNDVINPVKIEVSVYLRIKEVELSLIDWIKTKEFSKDISDYIFLDKTLPVSNALGRAGSPQAPLTTIFEYLLETITDNQKDYKKVQRWLVDNTGNHVIWQTNDPVYVGTKINVVFADKDNINGKNRSVALYSELFGFTAFN